MTCSSCAGCHAGASRQRSESGSQPRGCSAEGLQASDPCTRGSAAPTELALFRLPAACSGGVLPHCHRRLPSVWCCIPAGPGFLSCCCAAGTPPSPTSNVLTSLSLVPFLHAAGIPTSSSSRVWLSGRTASGWCRSCAKATSTLPSAMGKSAGTSGKQRGKQKGGCRLPALLLLGWWRRGLGACVHACGAPPAEPKKLKGMCSAGIC